MRSHVDRLVSGLYNSWCDDECLRGRPMCSVSGNELWG